MRNTIAHTMLVIGLPILNLVVTFALIGIAVRQKNDLDLYKEQLSKVNTERVELRKFLENHGYKIEGGYDKPVVITKLAEQF